MTSFLALTSIMFDINAYVFPLLLVFIAMVSSTRVAGRLRPAKSYVAHKLIVY